MAVALEILPLLSVTVNVTVFAPMLAQVKLEGDTFVEAMPHVAVEPLSTCAAVTAAWPVASRATLTFCATTCTVHCVRAMEYAPREP